MTSNEISHPTGTVAPESLLDRAEALSRVEGDGELMVSLLDIFFAEAGAMIASIRSAITNGEPESLEKAAHRLKGAVSIFCADALTQAAFELEKMGRGRDLANAAMAFEHVEKLMSNLEPALKQFRSELQSKL